MTAPKLIAYRRVSTARQGESGLGLEAQDTAIQGYRAMVGGIILATYEEVETGKKDTLENRPALQRAIAHAKRSKAVLVIAKLDRLARSVYVTAELHKSGVEFVACDNPHANRLTVQILAAVNEDEARRISIRTKEALAAYKARGGVLGAARPECRHNLKAASRVKGAAASGVVARELADEAYSDLAPMMTELRRQGVTQAAIACHLNVLGHTTRRGREWNQVQVMRVLNRFA
jgi:DNA invertase Pin-like site-specific DNA recombinase